MANESATPLKKGITNPFFISEIGKSPDFNSALIGPIMPPTTLSEPSKSIPVTLDPGIEPGTQSPPPVPGAPIWSEPAFQDFVTNILSGVAANQGAQTQPSVQSQPSANPQSVIIQNGVDMKKILIYGAIAAASYWAWKKWGK